jgi:AsmA protein
VKRVLVVAGVLALATVAAMVGLAWFVASQGQRLLAAASAAVGREITAEDVGIDIGLGVGVALRGVRVAADPAVGSPEPLVTADRVEMRVRVLPLLRREVVVDRVVVDAPTVNVVRDKAGRMNVGTFGARAGAAPTGGAPPAPAEEPAGQASAARPAFQVAMLRVRHGTLRYRDEMTGRTSTLHDMSADGRQPRVDAPMPVSFRSRLESPDVSLDEISGTGVLELAANPPTYRGSVEGGPGRLQKIPLERLTAKIEAKPPLLTLEESRVDLLGGHANASAQIGAPGKWLVAKVAAEGIDLARLPREASKPYPGGTLSLDGNVSGPSPEDRGFKQAVAGGGRFGVRDGRVAGLAIGRTIRDVLSVVLSDEDARKLRERYPELFAGDELRFTRLEGSGRLAQGHIRTDDLVVAAPSYEMRGQGSMSLDGALDFVLRLVASPALTEDLIHDKKIRKVVAGPEGRLVIPLRVTGDLDHPRVLPDASFAASLAAGALGGSSLEEAATGLLDRLLKPKPKKKGKGR